MIDRAGLADFLRRHRAALQTDDVGLPPGMRRRTPGLRREEVAGLAGMSTDYYTRLEQGRGPHPSAQLLGALARALRLDDDERDHLFHLAGTAAPAGRVRSTQLGPGLLALLPELERVPVVVASDTSEVLYRNALADALFRPLTDTTHRHGGHLIWTWFTDPRSRDRFPAEDHEHLSWNHVRDLRATAGRRAGAADVTELVDDLLAASPEFARMWATHDVGRRRFDLKRVDHPEVGRIELVCQHLHAPGDDIAVVTFLPRPGTDARERLDLLGVIGTQSFAPAAER